MSASVRDDGPVVDSGCLAGAANFLVLLGGGGPRRAVVGGIGSLAGAGVAVAVLNDSKAAVLLAALAIWCFFGAWFIHRFTPK